ncbi:MAG: MarR family transcriptional regulator [Lachnospiraceae bacterium]|nr:MarR family transcriptional regulator [Lachnospiraceae bacterium]MBQ4068539.1 MarR family transcriptional regulator [Lachnospiraceae bacterium]
MFNKEFVKVYMKFKLKFYKSLFEKIQSRETSLTTVETFCIETIYAMDNPTVSEFASFINISSPNAAYKINSLIKKGYLKKVQSEDDKREFHLEVTDKYLSYYNLSTSYIDEVSERIKSRFTEEEIETVEKVLRVMSEELMPELDDIRNIKV